MKKRISQICIFASFLLVTSLACYFFSPIVRTNAEEKTFDVDVTVNSIASLTLSTADLNLNVVPTSAGVFRSGSIVASVSTNSAFGYELYFSSENNETDMVSRGSSSVIDSNFSDPVTSLTMEANKWGYSLDNTNYLRIPASNSQVAIRNIYHSPTAEENDTTVYIGTKISSALPSGSYSKKVLFSLIAHDMPKTLDELTNMQEMNPGVCEVTAVGVTATLTDTRDGKSYTVAKLADNKCWMTQNLALINRTISSSDSDITADSYIIPNTNWGTTTSMSAKTQDAYVYNTGNASYGVYYNYVAATAGTITGMSNSSDVTESICPKGWTLPSYDEYQALFSAYNGGNENNSIILLEPPTNFVLSGMMPYQLKNPYEQGVDGRWWTTTIDNPNGTQYRRTLSIRSGYGIGGSSPRWNGTTIRCIAR